MPDDHEAPHGDPKNKEQQPDQPKDHTGWRTRSAGLAFLISRRGAACPAACWVYATCPSSEVGEPTGGSRFCALSLPVISRSFALRCSCIALIADQHLCRRRSTTQQSLRRPALRQVLASGLQVRHRLDVYHAAVIHWTLRSAVRPRRCPRPRLGVNAWLM